MFCLIGICVMAYWARKDRRRRSSPPPRPPQPHSSGTAHIALTSLTTFARRRQEERERSRAIFNQRNAEFQRELAARLERVRSERAAAYPETPRNTPEPSTLPSHPQQSSSAVRSSQPPTRLGSVEPPSHGSSAWSSRTSTPALHSRQPTPFSREQTPIIPENDQRRVSTSPAPSDHIYDSPASTLYESIDTSPEQTPPAIPPHQDQLSLPQPPAEPRSRFGRLLKQTSFFKCNP